MGSGAEASMDVSSGGPGNAFAIQTLTETTSVPTTTHLMSNAHAGAGVKSVSARKAAVNRPAWYSTRLVSACRSDL
jgi:hypothetical protein